jgi:hypothetical protein
MALWESLASCVKLGLSANASLAISVGQIKVLVDAAQGIILRLGQPCLIQMPFKAGACLV